MVGLKQNCSVVHCSSRQKRSNSKFCWHKDTEKLRNITLTKSAQPGKDFCCVFKARRTFFQCSWYVRVNYLFKLFLTMLLVYFFVSGVIDSQKSPSSDLTSHEFAVRLAALWPKKLAPVA